MFKFVDLRRFARAHPRLRRTFFAPTPKGDIDESQLNQIVAGDFTTGWFGIDNARVWLNAFKTDRARVASVLEIGSWEGRSTCFLAWLFPNATITCVDTFEGGDEHKSSAFETSDTERRFISNTNLFSDRLTVKKGRSCEVLPTLAAGFDLIYIDGSHRYEDVVIDSMLSWQLLNGGGFLMWDDYFWTMKKVYGRLGPKLAIDQFLTAFDGKYSLIFSRPQVCVRRR